MPGRKIRYGWRRLPIALIAGAGLVLLAAIAFVGVSVARNATASAPTATPIAPTVSVVTTAPSPTPTANVATSAPSPTPAASVATSAPTHAPLPTPATTAVREPPETAPDFTLRGAKGITLTLSEQLAEGPVVLVFFTSGGG